MPFGPLYLRRWWAVGSAIDQALQGAEAILPLTADPRNPFRGLVERLRLQLIEGLAAGAVTAHKPGPAQGAEVLGDSLPADRQLGRERGGTGAAARGKRLDQPPAGRVGEGREDVLAKLR